MIQQLRGKTAFIIGATGGLGKECAIYLAKRGCNLVLHGRNREKIDSLSAELAKNSADITITTFLHDFSGLTLASFLRQAETFPAPDILIPSFGPFCQKPLENHSIDDWIDMATLNLALPGALVSAFLPSMRAREYGRILLWGGTQNDIIRSSKTNCAYSAAKTGLVVLARSIAATQAEKNIAALVACPGIVALPQAGEEKNLSADQVKALKNMKSPEVTASTALGLLLESGYLVNGSSIRLDGGLVFP